MHTIDRFRPAIARSQALLSGFRTGILNRFAAAGSPRSYTARLLRAYGAVLLPALLVAGCYGFVHDGTPPEWQPDAKDVAAQKAALPTAGGPGAAVFNSKCAVCHQMTGQGIPGVYPNLAGSELATGDPHRPVRIVLHGFQGPIVRSGKSYNGVMQPWQNELTDQQIADVLTFVRSSWGNKAPAVDAALVKEIREKTKGQVGACSEEMLKQPI